MKKAVFVAVLFACASTASAPAQVQSVTVKVAFNKELNAKIIVAANGMTLYAGRATCGKGCARFWRPLAVNGCPSAGPGAKASLATRKRPDGIVQVTYAGHPLYSFRPGRKPGDVRGAGFQASWYVLSPSGKRIEPPPPPKASPAARADVRVAFSGTVGRNILVDAKGMTLYLFAADTAGKSSCIKECIASWPPLTTERKPSAGPGVSTSLLGTIKRDDGRLQITYAGHPLYTYAGGLGFGGDRQPGDARGQGFGAIWWVVSPSGKPIVTK